MKTERVSSAPVAATPPIPLWQWPVRITIVVVELILAYWCANQGELFFYQGF